MPIESRWARYKASPRPQPVKEPEPWWKALWVNTYSFVLVMAYMIAMAVLMPAIKLGMFHWQVWGQWKRGNKGGAVAIFVIACALFDVGIIYALVLIAQGKLDWW